MEKLKAKVIALYLPQYHPTKDNDEWWGKGFTEWTNVARAKKLYRNHYQPKVPADLGFYDLRLPEVREEQAKMAKRAGVTAFCYYHYWFGNGKEALERPFKEVVESGKPDFPFCICWANHSWYKKAWDIKAKNKDKLLVEQTYPGEEDYKAHFYSLLKAFKDPRYFKCKGKLLFMILNCHKETKDFMQCWKRLAEENGLPGFLFVSYSLGVNNLQTKFDTGVDAVNVCRLDDYARFGNIWTRIIRNIRLHILNQPSRYQYAKAINNLVGPEDRKINIYPSIVPNWDHTPRSGRRGYLLENCEPELFEKHCRMVIDEVKDKPEEDRIIFLKSWNEWGEGNYMEPDLRYGYGYIDALKRALTE